MHIDTTTTMVIVVVEAKAANLCLQIYKNTTSPIYSTPTSLAVDSRI